MVNRKQKKDAVAQEAMMDNTTFAEIHRDMKKDEYHQKIVAIFDETDINKLPEEEEGSILGELDINNMPVNELVKVVQQRVDTYFDEWSKEIEQGIEENRVAKEENRENSRENLSKALDFFEQEVLPSICGNIAGVSIKAGRDGRYDKTFIPYTPEPTLKDKYELARYFTGDIKPEPSNDYHGRKGNPQFIFDNEFSTRNYNAWPYDDLYIGSLPVGKVEVYEDQDGYWHTDYLLRDQPVVDKEDFGEYGRVSHGDYKRFLKEIERLTNAVKPNDITEEFAELKKMAERLNSPDIFPIPEGLDAMDWVSLKLGVSVTKRDEGEIVHCHTYERDFAHGIPHGGANGLYCNVFNAEVTNKETEGGKYNRDNVFSDESSDFDVIGGNGSMIVYSTAEQYPHYLGFRVTGADVWPGCNPESVATNILSTWHGDLYAKALLGDQDAAAQWIEKKKDRLHEHSWNSFKKLVNDLLRKFPELQERYKDQSWIEFLG